MEKDLLDLFKESQAELPKKFSTSTLDIAPVIRFVNSIFHLACLEDAAQVVVHKNQVLFQRQDTLTPITTLTPVEFKFLDYRIRQMARGSKAQNSGMISNFSVAGRVINVLIHFEGDSINLTLLPALH